jgi:hypothetical protein
MPAMNRIDSINSLSILKNSDFVFNVGVTLASYLQTIMSIIIFGRAVYIINKINKLAKIKATRIELIGLILLLIYRSIFLLRNLVNPAIYMGVMTMGLIISIIGLLILIGNYVRNSEYIYLLPFPIHSVMVYSKSGLLCYIRKFERLTPDMENKDILMTGAFTAIAALIQETLGSQAKIQHINAQQYQIFFNRLPNDSGNLVVISYGETAFFHKSLVRFVKTIDATLLEEINSSNDLNLLESKIDILIKKAFPYVNFIRRE